MRVDRQARLHPKPNEGSDSPSSRFGGEVDHQVEVTGHPGMSVEHDGHATHHDESNVGGVERGQDRLEQRHPATR